MDGHSHCCFSIQSAQPAHIAQLSSSTSSRAATYRDVKVGYGCEPYIQQSNNRHLRQIVAQFRTGSHWLNIETGRHKKVDRSGRICPMCVGKITNPDVLADCFDAFDSDEDAPDPIEDEHHAIFECSAYATTSIYSRNFTCGTGLRALTACLRIPDWPRRLVSNFAHITAGLGGPKMQLAHLIGSHQWEMPSCTGFSGFAWGLITSVEEGRHFNLPRASVSATCAILMH